LLQLNQFILEDDILVVKWLADLEIAAGVCESEGSVAPPWLQQ
jgi:hypothetical protein